MKLSFAAKLCVAYTAFVVLIFVLQHLAADPKGQFFIGSLAWFPVGFTFAALHLFPVMYANPWMNSPLFLFPASLLIVYLVGWAISAAIRKLS